MTSLDEDKVSYGAKRELKCNAMLVKFFDRQTIGSEIISEQRNSVGLLLGIQTSSKFHVSSPSLPTP